MPSHRPPMCRKLMDFSGPPCRDQIHHQVSMKWPTSLASATQALFWSASSCLFMEVKAPIIKTNGSKVFSYFHSVTACTWLTMEFLHAIQLLYCSINVCTIGQYFASRFWAPWSYVCRRQWTVWGKKCRHNLGWCRAGVVRHLSSSTIALQKSCGQNARGSTYHVVTPKYFADAWELNQGEDRCSKQ